MSKLSDFKEKKIRRGYPINWIYPNSWNINVMDDKTFDGLVESIRETKGEYLKTNPIQIRRIRKGYYEIIDGEKRWDACRILGYTHIPAIVENVDIEEAQVMNVIFNRNRKTSL